MCPIHVFWDINGYIKKKKLFLTGNKKYYSLPITKSAVSKISTYNKLFLWFWISFQDAVQNISGLFKEKKQTDNKMTMKNSLNDCISTNNVLSEFNKVFVTVV